MEIILKQDVPNLGYEHDIVIVRPGYANNYLIPKGYAVLATDSNKKISAEVLRQKSFKEERVRKEAEALATKLQDITVKVGAKAAQTGKIFGSVNNIQIAEAIKTQFNFEVDRKKIHIEGEHIKELGSYQATVRLYKEIQAIINFEVVAE